MMIFGAAFIPPHSLVAAVDGTRYRLFYLANDGDATTADAQLRHFLTAESYLSPVVLVSKATTLLRHQRGLRRYARRVYAILVCDSVAELAAHRIPLLDGSRTETGWWRTTGTAAELVSARLAEHRNTLRLSRLQRQSGTDLRPRRKPRGCLAKVAAAVTATVPEPRRRARLLRALLGRLVGTVSATEHRAVVTEVRAKCRALVPSVDELAHYQRSPKGRALHQVFYRMQRGDDFRELQIKYKQLDMDDWLVLNDHWNTVEKHPLKARPPR